MNTKRWLTILILAICLAAVCATAVACNNTTPQNTISFVLPQQAGVLPAITAEQGKAITPPTAPNVSGYRFDGWFLTDDFAGQSQVLPTTMPNADVTYYAKYTRLVTVAFVVDSGATPIAPIVDVAGAPLTAPQDPTTPTGEFLGWYTAPNGEGQQVTLPTTVPNADVTYYAHYQRYFSLSFQSSTTLTTGQMQTVYADKNGNVTIPACAFANDEMYFLGWTTAADGKLQFSTDGQITQGYASGATITLTQNTTLYAQFADSYIASDSNTTDVIYRHRNNVESGIGKVVLTRNGMPDKLGFLEESLDGIVSFTFYLPDDQGGEVNGRLSELDRTFTYRDSVYGFYVGYNHVTDKAIGEMFYADGYGVGGVFTMVGAQLTITAYGYYLFDTDYNEYVFVEIDPTTGDIVTDASGENKGFYFTMVSATVNDVAPPSGADTDAPLNGYFLRLSDEAGGYYDYQNGEMGSQMLELNGYGYARLFQSVNGATTLVAQGQYTPTENYADLSGEWLFTPDEQYATAQSFRFVLTYAASDTQYVYLFVRYDNEHVGTLTAANGDTITMDGYGGMTYLSSVGEFSGNFRYQSDGASPNLTFYAYNADGDRIANMYFDVDWQNGTFAVNNDEFIVDEAGVITAYRGSSKTVIIPAEVGGKTVTGIADNVFKAVVADDGTVTFSVEEVTIPATVTTIGALAFQNNYTLRKVTFLGATPPAVDFAASKDPFRWPSGSFVIVVPEEHKQAYVNAFSAAWTEASRTTEMYRIMGSVEVTLVPEFQVDEKGVLIAYNRPTDEDPNEPKSLTITVGQQQHGGADIAITAIGANVFMGATWLVAIDLGNVTVIGDAAFENCTSLVSVNFQNVTTVGIAAFFGCQLLGSNAQGKIALPSIQTIGDSAFEWCSSLKYVTAGANLTNVGANAFSFIKTDADISNPFFFELTGTTPPTLTSGMVGTESLGVFSGNSAFRIVVPNIDYAILCYQNGNWSSFSGSLYIPSGTEKGTYVGGSNVLKLDGRAILDNSTVWLYTLSGQAITFYQFDRETGTYATLAGNLTEGVITFTLEGVTYRFTNGTLPQTYVSTDGAYTLVVPQGNLLDPEVYMGQKVDVTLNGVAAKLLINNYNYKTVVGFDEQGTKQDIQICLANDGTFTYTKTPSPTSFTAADGSTLRIFGASGNLANVKLTTLTYRTADGTLTTVADYSSDYRAITEIGNGVYALSIQRLNDYYLVLVQTNGDTFTYHVGILARTAQLLSAPTGEKLVVYYEADGTTVSGIALLTATGAFVETTFEATQTGYTLTTVATPTQTYAVTVNTTDGTCTVTSLS